MRAGEDEDDEDDILAEPYDTTKFAGQFDNTERIKGLGLKMKASAFTFRDLAQHLFQTFVRMASGGIGHLSNIQEFPDLSVLGIQFLLNDIETHLRPFKMSRHFVQMNASGMFDNVQPIVQLSCGP